MRKPPATLSPTVGCGADALRSVLRAYGSSLYALFLQRGGEGCASCKKMTVTSSHYARHSAPKIPHGKFKLLTWTF